MLFNSYPFIFVFLPIVLLGYQIAGRFHRKAVIAWLAFSSLVFYGYWRPAMVFLLLASIGINYLGGALISGQIKTKVSARVWLIVAIAADLSLLCYYKYLFPSLNFLSNALGTSHHWMNVILPLGISFYTFTQIAFLVDLYQGIAQQQDLVSYSLFVTFFPHLIAGPILHHKEMMPQFRDKERSGLKLDDVVVGSSWFILGLGKKVLYADHFALIADPIFNTSQRLTTGSAWMGALAYALQLYFDFSGYSDMALGLARMFSIQFPLNFNSPFKSTSIIDFWQRWHMTLTHYIMAYLYTPLQRWARERRVKAGKSVARREMHKPGVFLSLVAGPMMVTLLLAGIWHGAGLQYIAYGALHGILLVINHAWNIMRKSPETEAAIHPRLAQLRRMGATLLTFLCVMVTFIFFRSRGLGHATQFLASLAGLHHGAGYSLPLGHKLAALLIALGLAVVWLLPNTQQILTRYQPSLDKIAWEDLRVPRWMQWSPNWMWAALLGVMFFVVLFQMEDPSTFLYFQF